MYYSIYKITNQIDGKFYIGAHKTKNLNDGYMGSGKYLKRAQEKHGIENFKKEILFVFASSEEMYSKEAELVTEDFLSFANTYNVKVGGFGGWDYINKNKLYGFSDVDVAKRGRVLCDIVMAERDGSKWRSKFFSEMTAEERRENAAKAVDTRRRRGYRASTAQMNTPEAIDRKKAKFKEIEHQSGSKNSNFGKMWITDGDKSRTIPRDSVIPEGWRIGRVMKK